MTTTRIFVGWSEPDAPQSADRLLSATELARLDEFRYAADRARFRSAHVLARLVVSSLTGEPAGSVVIRQQCRWCGAAHGNPYVDLPDGLGDAGAPAGPQAGRPYVSWSHAGERVVAAATYLGPVGIDVDSVPAVARANADRIALSPPERDLLQAVAHQHRSAAALGSPRQAAGVRQDRARAVLWTRKESLLKATGDGLTLAPSTIVVSPAGEPARLESWPSPELPPVTMADLDLGADYAACVSVLSKHPPLIELHHLDLKAAG
jgi:4'-phosphopantetheinyl transferase